jgi:hypothetical protein
MKIQPISFFRIMILTWNTLNCNTLLEWFIKWETVMRIICVASYCYFFLITSDLLVSDLDMMLFISSCNRVRI